MNLIILFVGVLSLVYKGGNAFSYIARNKLKLISYALITLINIRTGISVNYSEIPRILNSID